MTDTASKINMKNVVVTRVFEAPVEQVWQAWTDPEYVRQWWGPIGFTCPLAEMDFREGGASLVCMRAPEEWGGQDVYSTWSYTKITPNERIEYIFNFVDKEGHKLTPAQIGIPAGVPEDGHHVVTFKALSDNRTEMTMTEHGYTTDQAHDISKAGLEQCLDKMADSLK
jgi:uncharacterized protein YndB with AHSA1/START domain